MLLQLFTDLSRIELIRLTDLKQISVAVVGRDLQSKLIEYFLGLVNLCLLKVTQVVPAVVLSASVGLLLGAGASFYLRCDQSVRFKRRHAVHVLEEVGVVVWVRFVW